MKLAVVIFSLVGASIVIGASVKNLGEDVATQETTGSSLGKSSPGETAISGPENSSPQGTSVPSSGSPQDVCPCTVTDACKAEDKRHVFGSDQLDITKFGLISPCSEPDYIPCCPLNPPPPKSYNLTAADFSGLSKAELIKLGVLNDKDIIGSSSIPLSRPEQLNLLETHKTAIKTHQQLLLPAYPPRLPRPPTYGVPQIFQQSFMYNNQLYRPVGYDSHVLLLRRL